MNREIDFIFVSMLIIAVSSGFSFVTDRKWLLAVICVIATIGGIFHYILFPGILRTIIEWGFLGLSLLVLVIYNIRKRRHKKANK